MRRKLEDIARETGYSITTVSRALSGSSSISEKTRLLILEKARKTGYLQSAKTIALVLPRIDLAYSYREMIESLENMIQFGASPRATIALTLASKAHAFLQGRGYVVPQDIKDIALDVLRHRIIVTYEAEAEGVSSEDIVAKVLNKIAVP